MVEAGITTEQRLLDAIGKPCEDPVGEAVRIIYAYRSLNGGGKKLLDIGTVGGRIKVARLAAGLNAAQLGLRLNVSRWDVLQWETGRRDLPAAKVRGLARCLDVSEAWLVMETDEGAPVVRHAILRKEKPVIWTKFQRQKAEWKAAHAEAARLNAARERAKAEAAGRSRKRRRVTPKADTT